MTPHTRVPYHGPVVEGSQDRDNFVRNLITILYAGWWWGAAGEEPVEPKPISGSIREAPPVVTLDEIKLHCHIEPDQTAEDSLLQMLEMAAHLHTQNKLRRAFDATVGENVKLAMLVLIAHWYRNREASSALRLAEVPMAYDALLSPERDFPLGCY
jgi:uncharacterized phage protein (predicted DNA packaging)